MPRVYLLLIGALAVWRVTHLLAAEDGPEDLLLRLRRRLGFGFFGRLMDCFYCLSLWVAAPVALIVGESLLEQVLLWPALSGAAILLERATRRLDEAAIAYPLDDDDDEEVEGCPVAEADGASTFDRVA